MNVVKKILFAALAAAVLSYAPGVLAGDTAPAPSAPPCCAKGNCCASGPCCGLPGCCNADKSCCDPKTGACTNACGCTANHCCAKKAEISSRGHFVTEGKQTRWVPGPAPTEVKTPASCCAGPCCATK